MAVTTTGKFSSISPESGAVGYNESPGSDSTAIHPRVIIHHLYNLKGSGSEAICPKVVIYHLHDLNESGSEAIRPRVIIHHLYNLKGSGSEAIYPRVVIHHLHNLKGSDSEAIRPRSSIISAISRDPAQRPYAQDLLSGDVAGNDFVELTSGVEMTKTKFVEPRHLISKQLIRALAKAHELGGGDRSLPLVAESSFKQASELLKADDGVMRKGGEPHLSLFVKGGWESSALEPFGRHVKVHVDLVERERARSVKSPTHQRWVAELGSVLKWSVSHGVESVRFFNTDITWSSHVWRYSISGVGVPISTTGSVVSDDIGIGTVGGIGEGVSG
ncbi:hypothetical protein ACLOJK_038778 [Asimina triloba]